MSNIVENEKLIKICEYILLVLITIIGMGIVNYIVKLYIGNEEQFKKGEEEIIVGSLPVGVPFLVIGNNKHLAFGFTTDYRDKGDYVYCIIFDVIEGIK